MIDGKLLTEKLIKYAEKFLSLDALDVTYARNLLLREFALTEPYDGEVDLSYVEGLDVPDTLTEELTQYAKENGLWKDMEHLFSAHILGLLTPTPSQINKQFFEIKEKRGVQSACDWFYNLCIKNDYIQKTAIGKNLKWEFEDGDNVLEITINLSKPEKDNKEIAKLLQKSANQTKKYPACALCKENEGYGGTLTHPARSNIRTVSIPLGGEDWFVQYSPYAYYNEHCIAITKEHKPMTVDGGTVRKVLDFVDIFPNYFIGSNAALPIVGGSILNHEHYQGGRHILPMRRAKIKTELFSEKYPSVKAGILGWYNSAMRFTSKDKEELISAVSEVVRKWRNYTDESVNVYAFTDDTPHNTLSPIATKNGDEYTVDVILRNNLTTEEYPDGMFHAHPEYFNIKKEGIGLIEAMGLFILPGRLKRQTAEIEKILTGEVEYNPTELAKEDNDLYVHRNMIATLVEKANGKVTASQANALVTDYINNVCAKILECTAVFKHDEKGEKSFIAFADSCSFKIK